MNRRSLNFIIDVTAFVGLILLTATGVLVRYILPSGSGRLESIGTGIKAANKPITLLLGLTHHEWGEIHFWIAVVLMAILTFHLFLHWRWVVCVIRGKHPEESGFRAGLGILGFVVLLMLSLAPLIIPTEQYTRAELKGESEVIQRGYQTKDDAEIARHMEELKGKSENIVGSMTLNEIAQTANVPVDYIIEQLNLSENISPDQKLGRLKRLYGFEIDDIRRIVTDYKKK